MTTLNITLKYSTSKQLKIKKENKRVTEPYLTKINLCKVQSLAVNKDAPKTLEYLVSPPDINIFAGFDSQKACLNWVFERHVSLS